MNPCEYRMIYVLQYIAKTNRTTHTDDGIAARKDLQTENNLSQLFLVGCFNLPKNNRKKNNSSKV